MSQTTFDPESYKDAIRSEWRDAAPGWFRWIATLEADAAGGRVTRTLLEEACVDAGHRVLDVASGYGEPGLTAARLVGPDGHVTCVDIAGDMLAFAERRAKDEGIGHIEFIERDFEGIDELGPFDAIVSRAGLMYAVDPATTIGHLRSLLASGGRLAAAVWTTPDKVAFALPVAVMIEEFDVAPPPPGPGVFALGGSGVLRSLVTEAGFVDVAERKVTAVYEMRDPTEATRFVKDVAPPITRLIADRPAHEQQAVWDRVTEAWEVYRGDDGLVRLPCEALCVSGVNPGRS